VGEIVPSLLAADFGELALEIERVEAGGANRLHLDVMDGRFVPNISFGPLVVEAVHRRTRLFLEVHLMIEAPERYLSEFARAGAHLIFIHAEATPHPHRALAQIRQLGLAAGLALNPGTPLGYFEELLTEIDAALLMSVDPGFGGQSFIESTWGRLSRLRAWRDALNPSCQLEIDGGVGLANVADLARAGADLLVAGSSVFKPGEASARLKALRGELAGLG
jgi:ribulose-phosphate 3-epimerase